MPSYDEHACRLIGLHYGLDVPNLVLAVFVFQIYLLLLICLTAKLVVVEAAENTTANEEEIETIAPRIGLVSDVVEGIMVTLDVLLPPKTKEVFTSPVKEIPDILHSKLKAIYPGKLCI
jgi:hypothetical protein